MKDIFLILHFIGLAMGLGTSFAFFFLGRAASKMEPAEAGKFMLNASIIARMGQIGILILFLTGGYLMTPYWSSLGNMPFMITKLVLFVALGGVMGVMSGAIRKAKNGQPQQMLKVKKMGPVAMLISLTIVVMAVLTFH